MKKIFYILAFAALALTACDLKEEKIDIQHFKTPGVDNAFSDEYYENLRAWKKSKHVVSYVYFAAWAPPEGSVSLNIEYKSMKPRLISLPDSLDIVNLWMGTPMDTPTTDYCFYGNVKNPETGVIEFKPTSTYDYSPNAYADMKYCQRVKGTRFVMHADASKYGKQFDLKDPDTGEVKHWTLTSGNKASIEAYAELIVNIVISHGLDGVDFDYEGWGQTDLTNCIKKVAEYFGPRADTDLHPDKADPNKLLIVDYFGSAPSSAIAPYINYLVKQAYSSQGVSTGAASGFPESKMIYCEQYEQSSSAGPNYLNGGYTTGQKNPQGETMFTLESYARYAQSRGAGESGFGAYYIDKDYNNGNEALQAKGYKGYSFNNYAFLRRAIQIVNPAGAYTGE